MYSIGIVVMYLILHMTFIWVLYRILKNPSIVDVSWSLGLMISGLIYLGLVPLSSRNIVISFFLMIWALRLAFYLWYSRIRHGHVDKRYMELSKDWTISPSLGFFINFQFQGLLILIISSVFFLISKSGLTHITAIDYIALCIILSGIMGETLADIQLQRFKAEHKGAVCNTGLWHYSRHPNYFFDWLSWVGFALFAVQSPIGILSVISPLMLYILFTRMTGPITERGSVESRGQKYSVYQKQTPMFFPWIKKKHRP